MIYRTIIIDDEENSRARMKDLLTKHEDVIKIIDEADNGFDALEKINRLDPDLIFLDIKMPGLYAFDLIKKLKKQPIIIFASAHDEYALEAFKTNSIGYLLKPINQEHVDNVMSKLTSLSDNPANYKNLLEYFENKLNKKYTTRISSKLGDSIYLIDVNDIVYIKSRDKYTNIYTNAKYYPIEMSLIELEMKLDPNKFTRIHRGTIVNFSYINEIKKDFDGKLEIKMRDENNTWLTVSRPHASKIKSI